MRLRALFVFLPLAALAMRLPLTAQQSPHPAAPMTSSEERAILHAGADWQLVAPHLPDPATATAERLEIAGDVLRARRFPEDALDYYGYAMARGGDVSNLLKKMGVVRLELQQNALARAMFLRCVRARKKDDAAWNDLGVADYAMGEYATAIGEYKHAVRLNQQSAVFHANLGMAYFSSKSPAKAREQFALAMHYDPKILETRDQGGSTAHVVTTGDYPGLCFEMAKLFAGEQKPVAMKLWLAKASERGFDVRAGMRDNAVFKPWLRDPEIQMMLQNSARMRKGTVAMVTPLQGTPDAPAPNKVN